jgi:hypothetical protein
MTANIQLIVTGDMEVKSLADSLKSHFPGVREGQDVTWLKPRRSHGATSSRLRADSEPSTAMTNLAKAMVAEAIAGKTGEPADLVIVVDDVELDNVGQEQVVAGLFRKAVRAELERRRHSSSMGTHDRNVRSVRERCSFHVLRPMPEAYFFGDPLALQRAGAIRPPLLLHATDVEEFEVTDPAWLPICHATNQRHAACGRDWWRHEIHPKEYIAHLVGHSDPVGYNETVNGAAALASLNWPEVPKVVGDVTFARALFQDIADWFNVISPMPGLTSDVFYPGKGIRNDALLIRNM